MESIGSGKVYKFRDLRSIVFERVFSVNVINSYWLDIISKDPGMTNIIMTMDFVFGHRISVATDSISTLDNDLKSHYYEPKLISEPTINSSYTLGSGAASQRSFVVSIDARTLDPMAVVLGGDLITGFAEISLQIPDGDYESRYVLLKGDMSGGVVFGSIDEPLEFDVIDPKITFDKIQPEYICDENSFGNYNKGESIPEDSIGFRFPIVIDRNTSGVPCIGVLREDLSTGSYAHKFVVCLGHEHVVTAVFADGVQQVTNIDTSNSFSANGIKYLEISIINPSYSYYKDTSIYAYVARADGTERIVIDLIEEIIRTMTLYGPVGVDENLFSRAKTKCPTLLAQLLINASGESDIATAIDYIESTICGSFPMISMAYSGRGYGPVFTNRNSPVYVEELIVGQNLLYDRASGVQESSKDEIYNSYTIKYSFNGITNNHEKIIAVNSSNNVFCKISESRLGLREREPLESVIIHDDATAQYVANWLASHFSLPSYYVEYEGSPALMFMVQLGDNIKLTDEKLGLSDIKSTIEKIEYQRGRLVIGLRMWLLYDSIA